MKHDQQYYRILEKVICTTLISVVDVHTDTMQVEFLIASKMDEQLKIVARDYQMISTYTKENLLHPDDRELFDSLIHMDQLDALFQTGSEHAFEFRSKLLPEDTVYRWMKVRILMLEKKAKGYHIIASFEDIDDFKEKELKQERIRNFRMMALNNAFEELYIIDPARNQYFAFNVNAINEQRHPDGAFCFQDFITVIKQHIHPEDRKLCLERMNGANILKVFGSGKKEISFEYRIQDHKGMHYRWIYAVIMRMEEEDHSISAFMLLKDITEEKKASDLKVQYQMLKETMDMQIRHYQYMKESEDEMRYFRHDLKNHLLVMESLYEQGNIQEFEQYIKNMRGFLLKEKHIIHTDHSIIDALLNEKFAYAQQLGIDIVHHIRLAEGFELSAMDTCILLGNGLDNALEACKHIDQTKQQAMIDFKMVYAHGALVIRVANTIKQSENQQEITFETTKEDRTLHGLGISNMRRVVEEHQGMFQLQQQQDQVVLQMTLYL